MARLRGRAQHAFAFIRTVLVIFLGGTICLRRRLTASRLSCMFVELMSTAVVDGNKNPGTGPSMSHQPPRSHAASTTAAGLGGLFFTED